MELSILGNGGHSSFPPKTPITARLSQAVAALFDSPMSQELVAPAEDMFEHLGPHLPVLQRAALANRWLSEPLIIGKLDDTNGTRSQISTTMAPTVLEAGRQLNVLPLTARAVISVRIRPGHSTEDVLNHIRSVIDDQEIHVAAIGSEPSEPAPISDLSSQGFQDIRASIHEVFPDVLSAPGLLVGRTDSRRYLGLTENTFRFSPVRLEPDDIPRFHGTNERVSVEGFADMVKFYGQMLVKSTGKTNIAEAQRLMSP